MNKEEYFSDTQTELLETAKQIGEAALSEVTTRYGTGSGDGKAAIKELAYHNRLHTKDVRAGTLRMCRQLGLQPVDEAIALMAASAHDIVQLKPRGVMERESAEWLAVAMRQTNFDESDIVVAQLAILGTTPLQSPDGQIIGQQATIQTYPSPRAGIIATCVAAADMAQLYSPQGPLLSRRLYQEAHGCPLADDPVFDKEDIVASQSRSLQLLQSYHYPHPAAEGQFGGMRHQVIEHQMSITEDVRLGRIACWEELLQRDRDFAGQYSK